MPNTLPKLVCLIGPTASGKTDLSIKLAKKFNGEIISADSRQIYSGLDIGSAKITKKEMQGITHHLLDAAKPGTTYSLAEYKRNACRSIDAVIVRGKTPFLVGGTPLYAYAVIENYHIPHIPPNNRLRKRLETKSTDELFKELQKLDPKTAEIIDKNNPRRLIRALEVVKITGNSFLEYKKKGPKRYKTLKLALYHTREKLYERIDKRTDERISGIVKEIKKLLSMGVSPEWLKNLGLEYRFITLGILGELSPEESVEKLKFAIHSFARRQLTWLRKDKNIHWISSDNEAINLVEDFLEAV